MCAGGGVAARRGGSVRVGAVLKPGGNRPLTPGDEGVKRSRSIRTCDAHMGWGTRLPGLSWKKGHADGRPGHDGVQRTPVRFSRIAFAIIFSGFCRGLFARKVTCSKWAGPKSTKSVRSRGETGHSEGAWRAGAGRGVAHSALVEKTARLMRQLPRATVGWIGGARAREKWGEKPSKSGGVWKSQTPPLIAFGENNPRTNLTV